MPGLRHAAEAIVQAATEASMNKRQTTTPDSTLAHLIRAVGKVVFRMIPAAPAGRPAGGPVVFRHYL